MTGRRVVVRKRDGDLKGLTVDGQPLTSYLEDLVAKEVGVEIMADKHSIKKPRTPAYADKKDRDSGCSEWTRGEINRKRNKELMAMARGKSLTELAITALLCGEELGTMEIRDRMKDVNPDRRIGKDHVSNIMYHMTRRPELKRLLVIGKRGKGKSYRLLSTVVENCTAEDLFELHDKRSKATLVSLCKAYPAIEMQLKSESEKPSSKLPVDAGVPDKEKVDPPAIVPEAELAMTVQKIVDERIEAFRKDLSAHGIEIKVSGGIEFTFKLG